MPTPTYEITVENIGTVYSGDDGDEAVRCLHEYTRQARAGFYRADFPVCAWVDGELTKEIAS